MDCEHEQHFASQRQADETTILIGILELRQAQGRPPQNRNARSGQDLKRGCSLISLLRSSEHTQAEHSRSGVYESGRRCAEFNAQAVIGKTDRGKKHRLYRNFILRSLARRVLS